MCFSHTTTCVTPKTPRMDSATCRAAANVKIRSFNIKTDIACFHFAFSPCQRSGINPRFAQSSMILSMSPVSAFPVTEKQYTGFARFPRRSGDSVCGKFRKDMMNNSHSIWLRARIRTRSPRRKSGARRAANKKRPCLVHHAGTLQIRKIPVNWPYRQPKPPAGVAKRRNNCPLVTTIFRRYDRGHEDTSDPARRVACGRYAGVDCRRHRDGARWRIQP